MLEDLFNIIKQAGQNTVVNNPDVPNEHNQGVLADAAHTITSGFQNVIAGGGLQSILDLFKGRSGTQNQSGSSGLINNPIVSMMIGHFMSKLVNKFRMAPAKASQVASQIIPGSINNLAQQVNDPNNEKVTMDGLVNAVIGGGKQGEENATARNSSLQDIIDSFTGNSTNQGAGLDVGDLISSFTRKAQNNLENKDQHSGGGIMDKIRGFFGI
jgi:hypothetical protein